jgi:hypothetical protein
MLAQVCFLPFLVYERVTSEWPRDVSSPNIMSLKRLIAFKFAKNICASIPIIKSITHIAFSIIGQAYVNDPPCYAAALNISEAVAASATRAMGSLPCKKSERLRGRSSDPSNIKLTPGSGTSLPSSSST